MNVILEALAEHAVRKADAIALRDSTSSLNYRDLWQRIGELADDLEDSGSRRIALAANNGIPWAVADLACMRAGITLVPLPPFFTKLQVEHVLAEADIELILTDAAHANDWRDDGRFNRVAVSADLFGFHRKSAFIADVAAFDGKITFTSGSTGAPKGVMLSNDSIAATSEGIVSALGKLAPQQHLSVLPLSTLLENIAGLYAPLMNGSQSLLPDDGEVGLGGASLDIERFCDLLNKSTADTLILVPQLLTAVVTLVELGMLELSTFRLIAVGGGRVASQLLERASALGLPVCEGYGLSECCSVLTLNLPGEQRPGAVGRPLKHARIRLADDGEILVAAPRMAGYLNAPQTESSWYGTGDLGHFDEDGFLYIDGRKRNVFITAYGRNVNPEWPEAALTQHASIAQALVVGESREHNLALLWLRFPQTDEEVASAVATANAELPEYAQIHQWLVLPTPLPETLQTSNGRLRRSRALEEYDSFIHTHYADSSTPIAVNQR